MSKNPTARLAYANIFAKDIEGLSRFYTKLLGLALLPDHSSPIYRCLDAGGIELGFNAYPAYELLGVANRKPAEAGSVNVYLTFEVSSAAEVDDIAGDIETLGGRIIKPPYDTYYNARQTVLADPEGHVFRINFRNGPRVPAANVQDPPWTTGAPAS